MHDVALIEYILGFVLLSSAIGVLLLRQPVHACLSFLLTLFSLSGLYFELSSQFVGVMQILVYAGAILVLFMFVIVLFQDAHQNIASLPAQTPRLFADVSALLFLATLMYLGKNLMHVTMEKKEVDAGYGSVESLGKALYIDYFFPFEAVILLFLVAVVGAIYIAKKVE